MDLRTLGNQRLLPPICGGRGGSGNFSLTRQPSVYSLTFDEFQNTLGETSKDFGSMNLDELLKSIWDVEETQQTPQPPSSKQKYEDSGSVNLQKQESFSFPKLLSQKTVDEVWKAISKEDSIGPNLEQRFQSLGEVTLEDFLTRANTSQFATNPESMSSPCPRFQLNGGTSGLNNPLYLGTVPLSSGSSADQLSPDRIGKVSGDRSSGSSVPYSVNGELRGRKRSGTVDKVIDRRQRRMIKNRESAARSRARKQAYTTELEAEVAKLKEENQILREAKDEIEMQKNQVLKMMELQQRGK